MDDHVYKTIEITGTSAAGVEQAVQAALNKAAESIRNLRWFEVTCIRGNIDKNKLAHWQVSLKVGFTLED